MEDVRLDREKIKLQDKVRASSKYSNEMKRLVAEDLEYGLLPEQIETYLNKGYNLRQMRAVSDCLKREYPQEMIDAIKNLDAEKMSIAVEYFEKGIPLEDLIRIVDESQNAKAMHHNISLLYKTLKEAQEEQTDKQENISEVLEAVASVVKRIDEQTERYEEYQKTFALQKQKDDESYQDLLKNLSDKDKMINNQSRRINEAEKTIEQLTEEKRVLENRLAEEAVSEKFGVQAALEDAKVPAETRSAAPVIIEAENKENVPVEEYASSETGEIMFHNNFVKEGKGVSVERITKKSNPAVEIVSRLFTKKKATYNFIKLITDKKLSVAQISQIKLAMMKELDDDVLYLLVNPEMSVDTMAELIDFATLAKEKRLQRKRG